MKLLVETAGNFMLQEMGRNVVEAHRPSVIENTPFMMGRVAVNQLKVLGKLKDEATDAEFEAYAKECKADMALAVASFMSKFGIEEVTAKDKEPEPVLLPVTLVDQPAQPAPAKPGKKPQN